MCMPDCSDCNLLIDDKCSIHPHVEQILNRKMPPPPLGSCEIPIVESYLPLIKNGMRVLEIGCGAWDYIKKYCAEVGAHYEGIDTEKEYFGKKSVATRYENLADISFPDEYFDLIIGNQTMEHWEENGCSLEWGLYQCFRVCKTNGLVLLNIPIHFHGTKYFLLGKLEKILEKFKPFSKEIAFEYWGKNSKPIVEYFAHPGYWRLKDKSAYIVDIHAVKDKPLPKDIKKEWALNGFVAKLFHNPPSYILYRLLQVLGLMPKVIK
jgi:SAM-dependent methyltransferase